MTTAEASLEARRAGLCARGRHGRAITSSRGSTFWRCERSAREPDYPKYPPLPMLVCEGHEPLDDEASDARNRA